MTPRPKTISFAIAGSLLLALVEPLAAQQPVRPARSVTLAPRASAVGKPIPAALQAALDQAEAERAAAQAATAAGAAQGDDAAAKAAASEKLTKWKALVYDRRPSAILKAWAAPELKPYDPKEELEKAGDKGDGKVDGKVDGGGEQKAIDPDLREVVMQEFGVDPANVASQPAPAAGAPTPAAAAEKQLADKRLQREFEMFQRAVTLSRWNEVAAFFAGLDEKERAGAFEHFVKTLPRYPQTPEDQRVPQNLQEKNRFSFEEALILAGMWPGGFDKKNAGVLAPLVRRAIEDGGVVEECVRLLAVEINKPAEQQRVDRREAAMLLAAIGQEVELGAFLPTADEAEKENDREALNLLARYDLAMFAKEQRNSWLEGAWRVTQAVLAKGEVEEAEKQQALLRAVDLAPKVKKELGPAWLEASFTQQPDRGMEIIATIGTESARGFAQRAQDTEYRAKVLQLQKTAVEALLAAAPQLAEQWKPTLALLAGNWITEAVYSNQFSNSTSFGPVMQRDEFGNIFWTNQRLGGGGQVKAVEPVDVLAAQPGAQWVAMLNAELLPHFDAISAQLYLKLSEPEKAFPFIEQLATINARKAKDLADEFLRVWTRTSNPNANNSRTNPYMFIYGFDRRAGGIPLTRSKQQRNLAELASWVDRLRKLPIGGVDEKLLGQAFITAHSSAEVYKLETMERVFGDLGKLDPVLLGELLSKMRTNLATVWQRPDVQEQNKTRRSEKEMLAEVAAGYATALEVARRVMTTQGEHWALLSLSAAILHDQNNFQKQQKRDSKFAEARRAAFSTFERAAEDYVKRAPALRLDQETIGAFDTWFYAALGACDLPVIDEETVAAKSQLPLIKAAIESLPEGSRQRHLDMFANAMFTRMSSVKPQIKFRYLECGFEVVGDNAQAVEARKVYDYYLDLTRELRLECVVDGDTAVGTAPFGVRVDIVHSPEIERESGGFAKYAQNQNNMSYAYNYGRPLENYRDRFDEVVRAAVGEHFEVLSVTWNGEQMASKPAGAEGWRRTPYAYLLLQARGPEIDRIPAFQMDFDFLDTSGYAVLPIGTTPVAVDASHGTGEPRPYSGLKVTQLLDERRLDEGKVTLEIKASAKGLVPGLEDILDLPLPGFKIDKRDDQGASVAKFAEDQDHVDTERVWLLSLVPVDDRPQSFVFGKPKIEGMEAVYQRYADADLETVAANIALAGAHGTYVPVWFWFVFGGAAVLYAIWFFVSKPGGRGAGAVAARFAMPATVTPFTVVVLLQEIARNGKLDAAARERLQADIRRIEACHFGRAEDPALDLATVARDWLARAS